MEGKMERGNNALAYFMLMTAAICFTCIPFSFARAEIPKNELVIATPSEIETLDPAQHMSNGSKKGENLVYNGLIGYKGETAEIGPDLAESWTFGPDNSVTFKLRKGIKFHDGTPFTAEAVKFCWDRMLKADLSAAGKYKTYADLNSVKIVDDYTVTFTPTVPAPSMMNWFAGGQKFYVISPTYVKAHMTADDPLATKWMGTHECGTGPFELADWEPDSQYVFKKFPGYWGGTESLRPAPKVDKITYKIVKDASATRMMLEKGDIDVAEKLPADMIDKLTKTPGIKIKLADDWRIVFGIMNCRKPPFDNVKVRQAISYAVKYDELVNLVENNRVKRIAGTMLEGFLGYDPNLFRYEYDLEKARTLMKEAGFPNGFKATMIYSLDRYMGFDLISVMLQSYLKQIGIELNLQKMAWPTQVDVMKNGDFEMALQTWTSDYPEPVEQNFFFFSSKAFGGRWNWSYWENKESDELNDLLSTTVDEQKRAQIVHQIQQMAVDNAVYLYFYRAATPIAMRDNVEDLWFHPGGTWVPSPVYKK
jgi:peptide/nickel transport system substrate-binding protein